MLCREKLLQTEVSKEYSICLFYNKSAFSTEAILQGCANINWSRGGAEMMESQAMDGYCKKSKKRQRACLSATHTQIYRN